MSSRLLAEGSTNGDIWRKFSWRMKVYALKVTGDVPDFSWNELLHMTRQKGGFGLEYIISEGSSWEGSVRNPYITQNDLDAGARMFREHCVLCHGAGGSGGHGPALNHSGLQTR